MSPADLLDYFSSRRPAPANLRDLVGGRVAGARRRIAEALGVTEPAVAQWIEAGEIPELRQYQIERATEGALIADLPADRRQLKPAGAAMAKS